MSASDHATGAPRAYVPHLDGPNLRMGLAPMAVSNWLQVDRNWERYREHKLALGAADLARVYAQLPDADEAVAELSPLLRAHLLAHHADHFQESGDGALCHTPSGTPLAGSGRPSLFELSTWIQEDLLILQPHDDAAYRLTAGSLCLPSRWSLAEKLGQPMHAIHAPVPELNPRLGDRIDRFLNHLRPEHPVERFNWSLQSDASLAEFPGADEPVDALHYRVERQTLRRLPTTGAIVFTVRIYVVPFEVIASIPGAALQLRDDIAAMPAAFSAYKRMPFFQEAIAAFTDSTTQEP